MKDDEELYAVNTIIKLTAEDKPVFTNEQKAKLYSGM